MNTIKKISIKLKATFKSSFVRNIILVSSGTALAQVLTMLTSPIVTRIYSPEEYGVLTLYNSTLALLAIVGSLKYELVIPIVEEEDQAINSVVLSFLILIAFVILTAIVLKIWGYPILKVIGAEKLTKYWYLIPLGILFLQTYGILIQYAYRQKNFKGITQTMTIQSFVGNTSKILAGISGFGVIGLLFSRILSESVGLTTLSKPLLKKRKLFEKIRFKELRWLAHRYKKFPQYQFPSTLVGQLSINLPVFFLGFIYNSQVVGAFGLANAIVRLPMNLIGKSVSNVFFAEAASIGRTNPKRLKNLSDRLFKKLYIIGLFPLGVLLFFAPFLFTLVFGESWVEAGNFARILSVLIYFDFIFSPVSRVFEIFEKQAQVLALNIGRVIFNSIAFGIAIIYELSQYSTIILYTIGMSFMFFVTYLMAQRYMKDAIETINN